MKILVMTSINIIEEKVLKWYWWNNDPVLLLLLSIIEKNSDGINVLSKWNENGVKWRQWNNDNGMASMA